MVKLGNCDCKKKGGVIISDLDKIQNLNEIKDKHINDLLYGKDTERLLKTIDEEYFLTKEQIKMLEESLKSVEAIERTE